MYECSRCGNRRSSLNPHASDKFRFEKEDYIEGASSWCDLCRELTFFIKCQIGTDPVQILFKSSLENISSETPSGIANSRSDIQNSQAATLADRVNNWAVEAVDPPKEVGSFCVLPNRHGYLIRNQQSEDTDEKTPETSHNVTPASSLQPMQSNAGNSRDSSPAEVSKKASSVEGSTKTSKIKGIELLRATPPDHLKSVLPLEQDIRLSQDNPFAKTGGDSDEQKLKSKTSAEEIKSSDSTSKPYGPSLTVKDVKKLQRRYCSDRSSQPGTSQQAKAQAASGSHYKFREPAKKFSTIFEMQRKLLEKRRKMKKLALVRMKLDAECEMTRRELSILERKNHRESMGQSKRQSGGAHFTLSRLVSEMKSEKQQQEKGKKLFKKDVLGILLKTLLEEEVPLEEENEVDTNLKPEDKKPSDPPHEAKGEMETVTENDKGLKSESTVERSSAMKKQKRISRKKRKYIPIPDQLRNPFASPGNIGFDMPNAYHSTNSYQRSQPLEKSPRMCFLLSSVQRAIRSRLINDPLNVVRLIRSLSASVEVILRAPKALFCTIPCLEDEVLNLIEKKTHLTEMQKVEELQVSRSPIRCPDFDCQRVFFVSDFNNHLLKDHRTLTVERIKSRQTKTFFLDSNTTKLDRPKCHMLLMVRNKVIDSQAKHMKDLMPILLMSGRTHLSKTFEPMGSKAAKIISRIKPKSDMEFFVIWLTGIVPIGMKPLATISLWSILGRNTADCFAVNTAYINDIKAPNDAGHIFRRSSSIFLPMSMINKMTNNGRRFLAIQVRVY
ncbi:uncharacterized protein LOC108114743 [Drosophila eugracilis]|uniref:uncharacterized protein LOC108114743 n=1 Tax=Drosophila eugracilis TaxID=29029 RepID=UPI001BDAF761|nr:uncharacterized protein LOC108114743 [Drosophila eugracilis]